jgi:hypothetical protein
MALGKISTFPRLPKFSFLVGIGIMESAFLKDVSPRIRLVAHALLAIFVAQAANKFFVADLDHELLHGFYKRIFEFRGDAPDQYRILPLLPIKWLCLWLPFNHAVLIYNVIFGFGVLEIHWRLGRSLALSWRLGLSFGLSILYIFLQYTGWRPDTMGLLLLCGLSALAIKELRDATTRILVYGLCILVLSWSRADIALIYALFGTFYRKTQYAIWIPIPILSQILMQEAIFPEAQYYSKTIMLADNLKGFYLMQQPATYLFAAAVLIFWRPLRAFWAATIQKNLYFYLLIAGYLVLVLVIGRVNEYRLYLPFLPLLLVIAHGRKP